MTDPVQQAMDELNLAARGLHAAEDHAWNYPTEDNWDVVKRQSGRVEELRVRYNALIVAYDSTQ